MNIESSYQVAESIMRKCASSFYAAFGKIERAKFLDIAAVYAFCRYADDLADTKSHSKVMKLQLLNLRMPLEFVKFHLKHCLSKLTDSEVILILKSLRIKKI